MGHQGFERIGGPLRVPDKEHTLARLELHRHERVPDLTGVVRGAGQPTHVNHGGAVAVLTKMREAVGERAHDPDDAIVQNPWDHDDAERPPRAREGDWLAGSLRLAGQANESLVTRAVVGERPPVIGADGAVDLPEPPAAIGDAGERRGSQDQRRRVEGEGHERRTVAAGGGADGEHQSEDVRDAQCQARSRAPEGKVGEATERP